VITGAQGDQITLLGITKTALASHQADFTFT
jgi:hypothetical protein